MLFLTPLKIQFCCWNICRSYHGETSWRLVIDKRWWSDFVRRVVFHTEVTLTRPLTASWQMFLQNDVTEDKRWHIEVTRGQEMTRLCPARLMDVIRVRSSETRVISRKLIITVSGNMWPLTPCQDQLEHPALSRTLTAGAAENDWWLPVSSSSSSLIIVITHYHDDDDVNDGFDNDDEVDGDDDDESMFFYVSKK